MKVKSGSKNSSYQPSGKIGNMALVYLVLVCVVILPLVGALYALIIWHIPITFFNPLITVLFTIAIIIVHNLLVIEYGKVRNIQFANFSGHMAVVTALYAHWIIWIAIADGRWNLIEGSYYFLTHPSDLVNTIWRVNQTGTWWGPGGTWHGRPLTIIWTIETLIVYIWVISTVKKKVRMPFSEVTHKWLKPEEIPKKEFQERKLTTEPSQREAEDAGKTKQIIKMNKPIAAQELIDSLEKKGYKVSFEKYLRENPDPREVSYYEQSSVTIGSTRINLWSNSALYIEESNLVCLLAESVSESWHYVITIVNINSLEIESSRPRFHYQHEVEMIGSSKNMFTIKVKDELLHIDVSKFPEINIDQSQIEDYDIQIENTEEKSNRNVMEPENTPINKDTKFQESNSGTYYTAPIDLTKFSLSEIAVEEYLHFAGDYDDVISFTDGITTVPEDVKKIFEAKSGLWVNHTHQKIGFTANGYCSIYSITDIAKIVFVDSIGRYKDPRQFRIILKDGAERTIFRDGYWSTYDDETRKTISEVTGLPIEDQLIDNMYMDDDNWGSQDRH